MIVASVFFVCVAVVLIAYLFCSALEEGHEAKVSIAQAEQFTKMAALGYEQTVVSTLRHKSVDECVSEETYSHNVVWVKVKTCIDITDPKSGGPRGGQTHIADTAYPSGPATAFAYSTPETGRGEVYSAGAGKADSAGG